ncbi:hypothetical protein L1987_55416 [Smallanthus sonchifolius]|uniref:Uncharacterized protein n=1 Tax=Smallanthus sonchifolius TaxID=185202 RepID=A0ACB9E9V3_9ASTR|nr:hypothetical protein L1987_55416 [Smallanthus sonchifolius]
MIIPKPSIGVLVSLSYGFGVSTAGEYKVIRICLEFFPHNNPEEGEDYEFNIVLVEFYVIRTPSRGRSLANDIVFVKYECRSCWRFEQQSESTKHHSKLVQIHLMSKGQLYSSLLDHGFL